MRVLYFDCFAGASGDMIVGALIDLGVSFEAISDQLASLGLTDYTISARRVTRGGIAASKFDVETGETPQPERHLSDIHQIISNSSLADRVKARAIAVFERLAEAEARVHDTTPDRVHFHEVGAVDSILDIVGAVIGFEALGVERFISSPLRVGRGFVKAAHGTLPVPAPATAELLRGAPIYGGDLEGEFVTPTGAALIASLCGQFGPLPSVRVDRIGYGAGARNPDGLPNALRLILGDAAEDRTQAETIFVAETNIDDMNPQVYGYVSERAFALGALDLFMTPVQMKKGRPGVMLTVLVDVKNLDGVIDMILSETTTLGVRYYEASRRVLARAIETVETRYGSVRIKVARDGARTLHFQPEYDDCARLASLSAVPLVEVQEAAKSAYRAVMMEPGPGEEEAN